MFERSYLEVLMVLHPQSLINALLNMVVQLFGFQRPPGKGIEITTEVYIVVDSL